MLLKQVAGLKFPEEFLVKFFYKEGLFDKYGKVLELGCGNGNNLSLFYQYGWDVVGVDFNRKAIADANHNFSIIKDEYKIKTEYTFFQTDMISFINEIPIGSKFNAVIFPNSLYYLSINEIEYLLDLMVEKKIMANRSLFFFKIRLEDDYRFGKGERLGKNVFKLNIDETGEIGCIMTFFSKKSFISMIKKYFNSNSLKVSQVSYHNFQKQKRIWNSELVVWGKYLFNFLAVNFFDFAELNIMNNLTEVSLF